MKNLDIEQHRVLLKRIAKAIFKARYEPATAADPEAVATEVLRPYAPKLVFDWYGPQTPGLIE